MNDCAPSGLESSEISGCEEKGRRTRSSLMCLRPLLNGPAVAVWIVEEAERLVGAIAPSVDPGSVFQMADGCDGNAAFHELSTRRVDVSDHKLKTFQTPRS